MSKSVWVKLDIPSFPPSLPRLFPAEDVILSCPPIQPGIGGTCVEECSGDDECDEGERCCFNGCGHTCQTALVIPYYDPPLVCPVIDSLFAACVLECNLDDNSGCDEDELCCRTSCGTICSEGVIPDPLCPVLLERLPVSVIGAYIPQCDDNDSFSAVQCHESTGYCWCVNTKTGRPVSDLYPREVLPNCSCESQFIVTHSTSCLHIAWELLTSLVSSSNSLREITILSDKLRNNLG